MKDGPSPGPAKVIGRLLALPRPVAATLAVLYAGLIFSLSSLPGDSLGSGGPLSAYALNLAHAPLFFGLTVLVLAAMAPSGGDGKAVGWNVALAAVLVALAYAAFDEWHQSFVSGRAADPADLVTDLAGSLAAALVCREVARRAASARVFNAAAAPCALALAAAFVATWR